MNRARIAPWANDALDPSPTLMLKERYGLETMLAPIFGRFDLPGVGLANHVDLQRRVVDDCYPGRQAIEFFFFTAELEPSLL